jgi:putative ABC transport system permease protein
MSRNVYDRHFEDLGVTSVAAFLEPGAGSEDVVAAIRGALGERDVVVRATATLRRQALETFDRTFAVTGALRVLAVVVAFIGVWSALMSVQLERTRELATLRALGMTPVELGGVALIETGLMGLAAGLLSLPTGLLLARVLVDIINVRSFGWSMRLQHDPGLLLQALALSVAAALLASAYPLWRLARLPVAAALRQE